MATVPKLQYQHLERRPGSSYRQLWIKGRRIRAIVVDEHINGPQHLAPEQFAEDFQVPLEAVHEALDYVAHNQDVIQADYDLEAANLRSLGLDRPEETETLKDES